MEYWQGYMNWPLKKDWKCEICGSFHGLTWGLIHAQCRCNRCHTQYRMRDKEDKVVDIPICQLKPEYYDAFKKVIWPTYQQPIDEVTKEQWEATLVGK